MQYLFKKQHTQHIFLGVVFGVLSALSVACMGLLIKIIGDKASLASVLFSRFLIGFLCILPFALKHPKEILNVSEPYNVIKRTFFSLVGIACFYYSLSFISLTQGLLLNNSSALFVPLIVLVFYKIKTSYKMYLGILLGFLGIAFVLKPGANVIEGASLIGLASGFFAALAFVSIRFLTKNTSVLQLLCYYFLAGLVVTAAFLPLNWVALSGPTLLLLILLGIIGFFYQVFNTLALAKAPARLVTSLQFLSILFGVMSDYLIWKNTPDLYTLIGILFVIFGGVFTVYSGKKEFDLKEKK